MNADNFVNAVGMIDEKYLDIDNRSSKIRHKKILKKLIAPAAAAVLILCPLPAMTALGYSTAYNILYTVSPDIAQTFKPVNRSCESNGFEMTVISAEVSENEANVFLAIHDTTESCPYGDWDLYDSYDIKTGKDMVGHCSFSEYDSETHTAYFVVNLKTMDGSRLLNGKKVTFSVSQMLLGKIQTESDIDQIDLGSVSYESGTDPGKYNFNGKYGYSDMPEPEDYRFLIPQNEPLCSPAPGVQIMNIGYIDNALHILVKYEDQLETDNHGYVSVADSDGNKVCEKTEVGFYYRDRSGKDEMVEQIFPLDYEELKNYSLHGEFSTTQKHIYGDWEVTFSLD